MHRQFFFKFKERVTKVKKTFKGNQYLLMLRLNYVLLLLLLRFLMIEILRFHEDRLVMLSYFGSINCVP